MFIHQLADVHIDYFQFLPIINKAALNTADTCLCIDILSFLLNKCLVVGLYMCSVTQSCPPLCDTRAVACQAPLPWNFPGKDIGAHLLCPWNFPGKNTGMGCHFLLLDDTVGKYLTF